ncbi:HAD family hydrolase [Acidicapsa ligni]|uniref:HAD family hydrolase n=1 Tax=Acidicapsa ligni TaxID=542300 RepID=UPI0021DFD671|nr:HAD family phosphatase [Acidicapsa ligni]
MALRAVVFDYGMVLSNPPYLPAREQLKLISGLTEDQLEQHYWTDRHAYDRGDLTGLQFWQNLVTAAELTLTAEQIDDLNRHDATMWTTINPEMLEWRNELIQSGLKTAVLSNMGDSVLESIEQKFAWINDFDVLVWSYQIRMAKPQPEIYEYLLQKLGTLPEETLFLDDKLENIEAAHRLGMLGIQFSTLDRLREDLISAGLDAFLPLP